MRCCAVALALVLTVAPGSLASTAHAAARHPPMQPQTDTNSGSCTFKKTEYAAANALDESSSQNFVSVRDAGSITFKQSGTGCVAGTFFANGGAPSGDHVGLQVVLDGNPCPPLTNGYIFADTEFSSHSAAFFCGAHVLPGRHTIQVQYHSGFGGKVQLFQRTLEVNHT